MNYYILPIQPRISPAKRIVPPKPGKGERRPRPYSKADLDSLLATCRHFKPVCMISLKPPPHNRITNWNDLLTILRKFKNKLSNLHRRNDFPPAIFITEFDPIGEDTPYLLAAAFHMGFKSALSAEQRIVLKQWWLKIQKVPNNQGHYFDYAANGGGLKLQNYLAKDVNFRKGNRQPVKVPPPWVPTRTSCRLWFVVGSKKTPARFGRATMRNEGRIRRKFHHPQSAHCIYHLSAMTP